MQNKPPLFFFLLAAGAAFLNVLAIIGSSAFSVMIGGVIGLFSFGLFFSRLEGNLVKTSLLLVSFGLVIMILSALGLEGYCSIWSSIEWCERNLFILSAFPLFVSIVIWLLIPINWIYSKVRRS